MRSNRLVGLINTIYVYMLPQKERLTRDQFNRSFSVGKRMNLPYLQLIVDTTSESFHGSIVVSKKVYKKAVERNRLRRQLYSVLSTFHKNTKNTSIYIIITKPTIKTILPFKFREELKELLEKTQRN